MIPASSFYPRVFALVVSAVLGYALFLIFAPFAGSISWAGLLAFLLWPLNARLRRRLGERRGLVAGLLTLAVPVGVLLPLSALSIEFVGQVSSLAASLQAAAARFDIRSFADWQRVPWIAHVDAWLESHLSVSSHTLQVAVLGATHELLQRAPALSGALFFGALNSLFGLLLTLFLLFFFLADGDAMMRRAGGLLPLSPARTRELVQRLSGIARAIVFGTTLTALLQGVVLGIGFRITGLPSPVVFGVLGGLIAMLPVGGTTIVWLPAVLWLFGNHHYADGAIMIVWGVLLTGLDNVLKPLLISGRAPVSALVIFIGVLGGIGAFGAIGTIAGPVVLSLTIALLEFAEEARAPATVQSAP